MGPSVLVGGLGAAVSLTLGLCRKLRIEQLVRAADGESQNAQHRQTVQTATRDQSTGMLPAQLVRSRTSRRRGEESLPAALPDPPWLPQPLPRAVRVGGGSHPDADGGLWYGLRPGHRASERTSHAAATALHAHGAPLAPVEEHMDLAMHELEEASTRQLAARLAGCPDADKPRRAVRLGHAHGVRPGERAACLTTRAGLDASRGRMHESQRPRAQGQRYDRLPVSPESRQ